MKRESSVRPAGKAQVKFGIVPKLLLGILIPLFVVLIIISIFLGLQGSKTVNEIMGAELDAEAKSAASQVEAFFERYYGVSECLASTQITRDTTTEVTEGSIVAHRLYGSLLETLKLIQQDNAEDIDFVWLANLQTGEILQNDGTIFDRTQVDYSTRSWYKRNGKAGYHYYRSLYRCEYRRSHGHSGQPCLFQRRSCWYCWN